MRSLIVICLLFACGGRCLATYYCEDLDRQKIVDVSELGGIWYLIEKIVHNQERHLSINLTTCPVIHIAEDHSLSTTYTPPDKTFDTIYGPGYPYVPDNVKNNRNPTDPRSTFINEQDFLKQQEEYDRRTTYDYERRKGLHYFYMKRHFAMKRLKLYMSDGFYSVEHHLRYNSSDPGFWIMSGPEEGIQENIQHFAGTILVLKAVGSHLVLTLCHKSGEGQTREHYTMILSRENHLDSRDILNVHSMLVRLDQKTNYVEKSCNGAAMTTLSFALGLVIFGFYSLQGIWYLIERINHTDETGFMTDVFTCPVIHLSKLLSEFSTTHRPKEKTYETRYGTRYSHDGSPVFSTEEERRYIEAYNRYTTPSYKKHQEIHTIYIKHLYAIKYLRMYWDENSHTMEYQFKYSTNQPGFWISSDPDEGIPSSEKLFHFDGTVQVMKAVRNHLVLTYCTLLPRMKQVFSVILSRESYLDNRDIRGIHRLLKGQNLAVKAVEKFCNAASMNTSNLVLNPLIWCIVTLFVSTF